MATKKYRRRRRHRSSGFIVSLLTSVIIIGAIVASITVFLKVATIKVSGVTRYTEAEIIATSGIETGDNMFMVNKFEVEEKILNAYPYIKQIKIRRKLPDTFTFEIVERVPVAYLVSENNRWLIDEDAYVLEMVDETESLGLPKISGGKMVTPHAGSALILEDSTQLPALKEVLSALKQTEMTGDVRRVDISKIYDINLVYKEQFLVTLGDAASLTQKIKLLKAAVLKLGENEKGTINIKSTEEARFKPDMNVGLDEEMVSGAVSESASAETSESSETESENEG